MPVGPRTCQVGPRCDGRAELFKTSRRKLAERTGRATQNLGEKTTGVAQLSTWWTKLRWQRGCSAGGRGGQAKAWAKALPRFCLVRCPRSSAIEALRHRESSTVHSDGKLLWAPPVLCQRCVAPFALAVVRPVSG